MIVYFVYNILTFENFRFLMNSSNTKLKPLDHKKSLNANLPAPVQTTTKPVPKKPTVAAEK